MQGKFVLRKNTSVKKVLIQEVAYYSHREVVLKKTCSFQTTLL